MRPWITRCPRSQHGTRSASLTLPSALVRFALIAVFTILASPCAPAQEREAALIPNPHQPGGQYGRGLAIALPWAFVGNIVNGSVAFYRREAGAWKLRAMDRGPLGSQFGRAMATDGETLVVGMHVKGWPDAVRGAVRIYELNGERWEVLQKIDAPGFLGLGTLFGWSMAVDGDVMVISASGLDDPFMFAGMILIYERVQGLWTLSTKFGQETLDGPNGWHGSLGSGEMDVVGDMIAAPAPGFVGGVYIFERDDQGWRRTALISEPDPPDDGRSFGVGLALSDDGQTLVVGQPYPHRPPFAHSPGRAHVFERDQDGSWSRTTVLRASDEHTDPETSTKFGESIDIDGEAIVIGAKHSKGDPAFHGDEGAVYVFKRGADGTWPKTETLRWWGSNADNLTGLGVKVAIERGFVLAGSSGKPVHVFELTTGTSFCPAPMNSTGQPGRLSAVGSPVVVEDGLTLSARDCPPDQLGYFLAAWNQSAPVIVGDGLLCLGPPVFRIGGMIATGETGAAQLRLDLGDPRYAGAFDPGTTVHFQYWFKDTVGAGANFSNGVSVTFE